MVSGNDSRIARSIGADPSFEKSVDSAVRTKGTQAQWMNTFLERGLGRAKLVLRGRLRRAPGRRIFEGLQHT
jgi:hypothetical protein